MSKSELYPIMLLLTAVGFFFLAFSPFALGLLFLQTLLLSSIIIGMANGFMGLILFIVYVGGTMVLFTYCFMLSPLQNFGSRSKLYPLAVLMVGISYTTLSYHGTLMEFYWMSNILLLVGIILFVVMLSVVDMVDFSRGSMRVE
uniref:NADH dehydrogenase subunit 6 n=1 Tax=Zonosagitta nagae TaxID=648573 RepID=A0A0U1T4S5_9BILA|nr:NADH dehydrogenase subunit 6 [Zonosagitta nagae]